MGRKYGNKIKYKKVKKMDFKSIYLERDDFKGYLGLIDFIEVEKPLVKSYFGQELTLIDQGYSWLEIFPLDKNYCITAKYNDRGELIKWYIDIVSSVGLEDGQPYMEDFYLDLDLMPNGDYEILDRDELDQALEEEVISKEDYQAALDSLDKFLRELDLDQLKNFSREMRKALD